MSSSSTPSDSDQSENSSDGGVTVHVLALFTSFVGPAIVYAVSDNDFTRENARNALNWHLTVLVLVVVAFVTGFLGTNEVPFTVPSPLDTVFTFISVPLLLAMFPAVFATFAFTAVATYKAASGSTWSYPGAIDIIGRFR